jgi:adenylate cyclase
VRAVSALSDQIARAVEDHGGRVFNTAGDGFMLEFPTVTGALEAADALAGTAVAPIRVGVHVGEVSVRKGGDLLGHGVNVAARLQALAPPGGVMVSDDVRRAVRGVYGKRLVLYGRVKLDNLQEASAVFQLVAPGGKAKRRLPPRGMATAAGLAAVAAGLWLLLPLAPSKPKDIRAAVQTFTTGSGAPAGLGAGIADRIASALEAQQVPTVSRTLAGGNLSAVRFLISGEVERDGADLKVRVHIDDRRAGLILWSTSFQRPTAEADALQDEAATKVADVVSSVRQRLGTAAGQMDPAALAAYMKAMDLVRLGDMEKVRQAFQQVVLLAPKVARAHSAYAFSTANTLSDELPAVAAHRRTEAMAEAHTALALDPHDGEAYLTLYRLAPPGDLAQQEAWLLKGLSADPDNGSLYNYEAGLLGSVGRNAEAFAAYNRAQELDPLSPPKTVGVIYALASMGRYGDAISQSRNAERLWPTFAIFHWATLTLSSLYGPPDQALVLLDADRKGARPLDAADSAALRSLVLFRQGRLPKVQAVKAVLAADRPGSDINLAALVAALALLDGRDEAFALLGRLPDDILARSPIDLFVPATAPLRADSRFMPLAARLGLIRYWRTTGHWPDFCAAPGAPYDCRKAAAAAEAAAAHAA